MGNGLEGMEELTVYDVDDNYGQDDETRVLIEKLVASKEDEQDYRRECRRLIVLR